MTLVRCLVLLITLTMNLLILNSCADKGPFFTDSVDEKLDVRLSADKSEYYSGEPINLRYYVNKTASLTMWVTMPGGSRYRYFSNNIRYKGSYDYNLYATYPPGYRLVTLIAVANNGQTSEVAISYRIR